MSVLTLNDLRHRFTPSHVVSVISGEARPDKRKSAVHDFGLSEDEGHLIVSSLLHHGTSDAPPVEQPTRQREVVLRAEKTLNAKCDMCHGADTTDTSLHWRKMSLRYSSSFLAELVGRIGGTESRCRYEGKPLADSEILEFRDQMKVTSGADKTFSRLEVRNSKEIILRAQCGSCHAGGPTPMRRLDLSLIWGTIKENWLRAFLTAPVPVRPSGISVGDGRRHPRFNFSAAEVEKLISRFREIAVFKSNRRMEQSLTEVRRSSVERMIETRYGCLGCHRLNRRGGLIGPSLDEVGTRLTPAAIRRVLTKPQHYNSGSIMPPFAYAHDEKRLSDLVAYLADHKVELGVDASIENPSAYVPWSELGLRNSEWSEMESGAAIYGVNCAPCHGIEGKGDGFNAPFLTAKPMRHESATRLRDSTDERLAMGIRLGGWVLGKSSEMPGFGTLLDGDKVAKVIAHLRQLCACEGPSWSRDTAP